MFKYLNELLKAICYYWLFELETVFAGMKITKTLFQESESNQIVTPENKLF